MAILDGVHCNNVVIVINRIIIRYVFLITNQHNCHHHHHRQEQPAEQYLRSQPGDRIRGGEQRSTRVHGEPSQVDTLYWYCRDF